MPVVDITVLEGWSAPDLQAVTESIQGAIIKSGFAETDRFQRLHVLKPEHFIFDRLYPNLSAPRSHQFMMIEFSLSTGRSEEFKQRLMETVVENLHQSLGIAPTDVMIFFWETERANISFAAGLPVTSLAKSQ